MRTMSIDLRRLEVAEAAEALREQMDILLDRAAERILKTPVAGSAAWHTMWRNRDSFDGQAQLRRHLLIRISVAQHLGLDTTWPPEQHARTRRPPQPSRTDRRLGDLAGQADSMIYNYSCSTHNPHGYWRVSESCCTAIYFVCR